MNAFQDATSERQAGLSSIAPAKRGAWHEGGPVGANLVKGQAEQRSVIGSGGAGGGGGGGPPASTGGPSYPGLEARVAILEIEMKDVKAGINRLELSAARVEGVLAALATKADMATTAGSVAALTERLTGIDRRLADVETAVRDTVKTAIGKAIGPVQLPAILVSTIVALGLLLAGYSWIAKQPWFPH